MVVDITVSASGLKPGLHGVHLHAVGKCEPDFAAAGGHFDPGPASNTDPDANHPFHMGDVPNLEVGQDGKGTLKAVTTRVTLSDGPLSLFDADGTAIIIHGNETRAITGEPKSGVSGGPRVACGVFTKAKSTDRTITRNHPRFFDSGLPAHRSPAPARERPVRRRPRFGKLVVLGDDERRNAAGLRHASNDSRQARAARPPRVPRPDARASAAPAGARPLAPGERAPGSQEQPRR